MTVQGTRWVLPLAFTVLASLVAGTSRAPAADDVRPPTLACVDGLLARHLGHPGERTPRRHRWLCDVDGQMNGVCAFGRRCHMCVRACPALASPMQIKGIRIRCHVTVPVPVGQQQQEGGVDLGMYLHQHAHAVRADAELRHRDRGLRRPRTWRSRSVLCVRARAHRVRVGSELSLRGCQPVSAALRHMRG